MSTADTRASRALARNATWLTVGRVGSQVFSVALTVVVARGLGTAGFGRYAFVGAVLIIGNVVTTFGTDSLLIREIAGGRAEPARRLAAALGLQLVLSVAFVVLVAAGAGFLPGRMADTVAALRIYALTLFPLAFYSVFSAALRAWERMDLYALLVVGTAALQTAVAAVAVQANSSLPGLVLSLLLAQVVAAVLAWRLCLVAQPGFALAAPATPRAIVSMLKRAWPLALLSGLGILGQRIGVVLLAVLAGDMPAGWFAAAARVVEGLKLTQYAWLGALFPIASRLTPEGTSGAGTAAREPLSELMRKSRLVLLALGLGAALAATLLAAPLVTLLYGRAYRPAVSALRILSWALVPYAAGAPTSLALVSTGHERVVVRAAGVAFGLTALAGALLIPLGGVVGACAAVLAGEVVGSVILLLERARIATPRFAPDAAT